VQPAEDTAGGHRPGSCKNLYRQFETAVDKYKEGVMQLDRLGFQIFTHSIGDRAIRIALDAYEAANKASGHTDARDKIEHIEDPSAADIPRFGKLGVIAACSRCIRLQTTMF
jgi:predicted amidohydrolase YtcJ